MMNGEDTPTALDIAKGMVMASEGCELTAYQDPGGVCTIGYGHTGPGVYPGLKIDQTQAERLLETDLLLAQHAVLSLAPSLYSCIHKQAAMIDFVFNLGARRFHDSTLLKLILNNHWEAVPVELSKWVWDAGKVLPGLVTRRKAEAALWQLPD